MPNKSTLLTTSTVAELLHTTVSTVNRWAASGRLPVSIQAPGSTGARMFDLGEVLAFRDTLTQDVAS